MAKEVIMPKVDMDQETGTVVEWRKKNGENVKTGDVILVIETDKVAVDVESPGTGILEGISVGPGDVVPIGTVIAYLLAEGEALPKGQMPAQKPKKIFPKSQDVILPPQAATPLARNMAAAHGIDLNTIVPSGKGSKVTKADVETRLHDESSERIDGKVYASPAARRAAKESDVDLTFVSGSGPNGRIQTHDV